MQIGCKSRRLPAKLVKGRWRYGAVYALLQCCQFLRVRAFSAGSSRLQEISARISALQEIFCVAENIAERFLRRRKFLHCRKFLQGRYREPKTYFSRSYWGGEGKVIFILLWPHSSSELHDTVTPWQLGDNLQTYSDSFLAFLAAPHFRLSE